MMKEGEAMMKKGEEMMKEPAMEEEGKAMMMKSDAMMETRPVEDDLATMSVEKIVEFMDAVEVAKVEVMEKAEAMPKAPLIHSQGDFQPRAHKVKGKAILITSDDGNILRFENFETINGPNLHIYLSTGLGTSDIIDLGEIKATKGNVNYALDPSIDLNKYNKVLVWCVPFRILFSYAALL